MRPVAAAYHGGGGCRGKRPHRHPGELLVDGPCIDIYAPGVSIRSTVLGGSNGLKSGTSMSSPHMAGVATLYKSRNGDVSQATLHAFLLNNATTGVVRGSLAGTPNRLLFTNL